MQIFFINYNQFIESSGIHIFFLANELEKAGISCTVFIPQTQVNPYIFGPPLFHIVEFDNYKKFDMPFFRRKKIILHAWTPRENVRRFTETVSSENKLPYFVHLEDNEETILAKEFQMSFPEIASMPEEEIESQLPPNVIHPLKYQHFLENAAGITNIFDTLNVFVPRNVPSQTIWPACETDIFNFSYQPDLEVRKDLGLCDTDFVITYTGNMHRSNAEEITLLYRGIGLLNEINSNVKLIRTGTNTCQFHTDVSEIQSKYVLELGTQPAAQIRRYLATADALVQPGAANEFNNYRFPSKLPMYFASGRPVILPPANIGKYVIDGKECLHIQNGSVEELVDKITLLINSKDLRLKLGAAGRTFAQRNFSWEKSAKELVSFYERSLRLHRIKQIKRIFSLPSSKLAKVEN